MTTYYCATCGFTKEAKQEPRTNCPACGCPKCEKTEWLTAAPQTPPDTEDHRGAAPCRDCTEGYVPYTVRRAIEKGHLSTEEPANTEDTGE